MDELNKNQSTTNQEKKPNYIVLAIILFILGIALGYFLRGYMLTQEQINPNQDVESIESENQNLTLLLNDTSKKDKNYLNARNVKDLIVLARFESENLLNGNFQTDDHSWEHFEHLNFGYSFDYPSPLRVGSGDPQMDPLVIEASESRTVILSIVFNSLFYIERLNPEKNSITIGNHTGERTVYTFDFNGSLKDLVDDLVFYTENSNPTDYPPVVTEPIEKTQVAGVEAYRFQTRGNCVMGSYARCPSYDHLDSVINYIVFRKEGNNYIIGYDPDYSIMAEEIVGTLSFEN